MLYPAWAALSTDEQFAFAARGTGPQRGGLGHALSHIRAARTAAGQSHSHPTLSKAWKAVDSKPPNPAGFVECLKEYIGMARNVDALAESIDRAQHAIRLAQCHPAYAKPAKPTPAKVATPRPLDQAGGMAPVARPPLVSPGAHRRSIEAVTEPGPFRPCPELVEILAPAYRCRHFDGACYKLNPGWHPVHGHIPRGFTGAFGKLDEIELVLVVGEPGKPFDDDRYDPESSPVEQIDKIAEFSFHALQRREQHTRVFNTNFCGILDACWPELRGDLYEQLRRTWKAESYLCSTPRELDDVPKASWSVCGREYLKPQLSLLAERGAAIVACGDKAHRRVEAIGWTRWAPGVPLGRGVFLAVRAISPPEGNKPRAHDDYRKIPGYVAECSARRRRQ
jgi:hypothetical protein